MIWSFEVCLQSNQIEKGPNLLQEQTLLVSHLLQHFGVVTNFVAVLLFFPLPLLQVHLLALLFSVKTFDLTLDI